MSVEIGLWKMGNDLLPLTASSLDTEDRLERLLKQKVDLLGIDLMVIVTQVQTDSGKRIDILAVDAEGILHVIELKRNRTPRDVVAQTLDYGSWVCKLTNEAVRNLFETNSGNAKAFDAAFVEHLGTDPPESLNDAHRLIIVASSLDPSTERIMGYLSEEHGVPINAVFFQYFKDGDNEYLARAWLIDPNQAESRASRSSSATSTKEPWNGRDFYVSFGSGRSWDQARQIGYISGGGGRWYSQTLNRLFAGARVFVNVPKQGYVGVGVVRETIKPVQDFMVAIDGKETPFLKAGLDTSGMGINPEDPDRNEYLVKVEWLKTLPLNEAVWETGMFAVQHTACKLRHSFTVERLLSRFGLDE